MASAQEKADFEGELRFHEREWLIQRIGWLLMLAFIIAAALGAFGNGVLSSQRIGDDQLALKYERFIRYASSTRLELTFLPVADEMGTVSFDISEAYLNAFELQTVMPEPQSMEMHGDSIRFTYASSTAPTTVTLDLMPEKFGRKAGVIKVGDRELHLAQFIYP